MSVNRGVEWALLRARRVARRRELLAAGFVLVVLALLVPQVSLGGGAPSRPAVAPAPAGTTPPMSTVTPSPAPSPTPTPTPTPAATTVGPPTPTTAAVPDPAVTPDRAAMRRAEHVAVYFVRAWTDHDMPDQQWRGEIARWTAQSLTLQVLFTDRTTIPRGKVTSHLILVPGVDSVDVEVAIEENPLKVTVQDDGDGWRVTSYGWSK